MFGITAAALVASTGLFAVLLKAQPQPGAWPGGHGMRGPAAVLGMMGYALDLTDAQKGQIRDIMKQTFDANRNVREQLMKVHEQEVNAVKAGRSEAELRALAAQAAPLIANLHAAHLVTGAKVYQVLTPAQRDKADKIREDMKTRIRGRFAHGLGRPLEE
jgi:Spy/CpxP family protein refolding chaperone